MNNLLESYLNRLSIASLNPMQEAMLDAFERYDQLTLIAPTGSGKTLGFLLPLLKRLRRGEAGIQAMVICPSRELALQIEQVFRSMSTGFKVNCFYGGHPIWVEKDSLSEPPALLIGTPGRIADHIRQGTFDPGTVRVLVLDEFDKTLELGFEDDTRSILASLNGLQKRVLISATKMLKLPDFVDFVSAYELHYEKEESEVRLKIRLVRAEGHDKLETLFRLLCVVGDAPTLVFCNHRMAVDRISQLLGDKGIAHDVYHGGLKQDEREQALAKFRNGTYRILLATDLAGRGLDIPAIEHVVHYQPAETLETFIHRNGRTARIRAEGSAYILLSEDEKLPEYLSVEPESFHFPDELRLPSPPEWSTLRFDAGKKDKISKGDIVGFLTRAGRLSGDDIGVIEVYDFVAYVAVKASKARETLSFITGEKIKKKKVPVSISW